MTPAARLVSIVVIEDRFEAGYEVPRSGASASPRAKGPTAEIQWIQSL